MARIRLALCQLDVVVGDLDGNVGRIVAALETAERAGADLAVFPELAITGYPPEDLALKPGFVADNRAALDAVAARATGCTAVVGFIDAGRDLYNAAAVCAGGAVVGVEHKRLLPNYAVFDEQRTFAPGTATPRLYDVAGVPVGVSICEDAWAPDGPVARLAAGGAELVANLNASPYQRGRVEARERMLATRAADASAALVYVNLVGGQDELVFDGASLVFGMDGTLLARAPQFVDTTWIVDVDLPPVFAKRQRDPRGRASADPLEVVAATPAAVASTPHTLLGSAGPVAASPTGAASPLLGGGAGPVVSSAPGSRGPATDPPVHPLLDPDAEVYGALVLGTRDYVDKNGFREVVVGLSGGVDSSLVATIAADAIGADRVHGVSMPSRYSSEGSVTDAAELARNLGIALHTVPIEPAHTAFTAMLAPAFAGRPEDLTEENLQSRIRGVLLMALSNKFGWLVLTTGNKSEMAVGYSTLYGDTAGGFAVIKDVPKTLVYRLCAWRNANGGPVIPEAVLTKPPSAELRPDQRDDQSLPAYEVLDPLLEAYVEGDRTASELEDLGFPPDLVRRVTRLVDTAEYKRRQSPPGVRITAKAFGKDRRLPITNAYRA